MRLLQLCIGLLLAFSMALLATAPAAASYPTRPVRLIVPFPPGGPSDLYARLLGQQLGEKLGQPVVVENRAGAATLIGTSAVARAPADGYTLLFTASTLVISVQLQKDKPFDPLKDFMPVSPMLTYPFYLVVNNALPVTNVQELIAYGKANPGKLSYGSVGTGSGAHLVAEMFRNQAGFEAVHVPYKGVAEFLQAVQTGQVHYVFDSPGSAQPTVAAGRARGIAVTSAKRWATLPDVPTMQEAGFAGFEKGLWMGVLAPAGTPADVVGRLHAAITEILQAPHTRERIEKAGFQVLSETPDAFRRRLASDSEQWGEVIRRNRISAD